MNWNELTSIEDLEKIEGTSFDKPVMIFKHSTRCSISSASLDRVQRKWENTTDDILDVYFLDLISYRDISNAVAVKFGVDHQSPQVLIIKDGKAVFDASHFGIDYEEIKKVAQSELA